MSKRSSFQTLTDKTEISFVTANHVFPRVWGHRGGTGHLGLPENTMEAFIGGLNAGGQGVESGKWTTRKSMRFI